MDGDDFAFLCEHNGELPPKKPKPDPAENQNQDGVFVEFSKNYRQKSGGETTSFSPGGGDKPPDSK
jgi:hypothetical protein